MGDTIARPDGADANAARGGVSEALLRVGELGAVWLRGGYAVTWA